MHIGTPLAWWLVHRHVLVCCPYEFSKLNPTRQASADHLITIMPRIVSIIVILVILSQSFAKKCNRKKSKCRNNEPLVLNVSQLEPGHKARCPG